MVLPNTVFILYHTFDKLPYCHCKRFLIHIQILLNTYILFQANAVLDLIGFPEYILNHTALDERYEEVNVRYEEVHVG